MASNHPESKQNRKVDVANTEKMCHETKDIVFCFVFNFGDLLVHSQVVLIDTEHHLNFRCSTLQETFSFPLGILSTPSEKVLKIEFMS